MESSANAPMGEQLPTSMSLGFEHVKSYQIRRNNPPKQVLHEQAAERGAQPPVRATERQATYPHRISERVLSMRRHSGASAVSQFVEDMPLQLIEANDSIGAKQHVWVKKWSNEEGSEKKMAKLMEEEIPEPNAPL